jgi:divalent metal cation (Fe/Co/Zn/Cd) transporter
VGLAAALLSNQYYWWIDAVGAMVLALYTITNWGKSVIENAASLVGQAAPPELVAKVTYMAFNHHPKIRKLDTVRAFLLGGLYFVEVCRQLLCTFYHVKPLATRGTYSSF